MNVLEIIRKKRDKESLTSKEIEFIIRSFTDGKIPDYQFSSFLMAIYLNGMSREETSFLTDAMLNSGITADLSEIKGIKIDKHSTGGVGDKTSLIIAPVAAAAGICVPMISGRGLGHTGGTLDKLESIPGFRTSLTLNEYKNVLAKCGAVMIGQTAEIAPADKLIYALRDVTATIESIPLITASIMSKKLAEGIDGLVLDIKTGTGAFMKRFEEAETLAQSLINTAKLFNKKVIGFITDMNQPLGKYIGNWLEVVESVKILKGEELNGDLARLSLYLSGAMLLLGNKAADLDEGIKKSEELIINGAAYKKFMEIVTLQGGDVSFIENPEKYPQANFSEKMYVTESGYVSKLDTYEIGMSAVELGAGRKIKEDNVDPKAGIIFHVKLGDKITKQTLLAELFSDSREGINAATERILRAIKITETKPEIPELIKKIL